MPGCRDVALEEYRRGPAQALSRPLRRIEHPAEAVAVPRHLHAHAAPACGGLDHYRVANRFGDLEGACQGTGMLSPTGQHRYLDVDGEFTSRELVARHGDRLERRTDPH